MSIVALVFIGVLNLFLSKYKRKIITVPSLAQVEQKTVRSTKVAVSNINKITQQQKTSTSLEDKVRPHISRSELNERLNSNRLIATQTNRFEMPVNRYLTNVSGNYTWAANVRAVPKNLFRSDIGKVIGYLDDMVLVETISAPADSFFVIKKNSSELVGYYTGKIIAANYGPDFLAFIDSRGLSSETIGRTMVISIESIEDALAIISDAKARFRGMNIDLDVNFSKNVVK